MWNFGSKNGVYFRVFSKFGLLNRFTLFSNKISKGWSFSMPMKDILYSSE